MKDNLFKEKIIFINFRLILKNFNKKKNLYKNCFNNLGF